MRDPSPPHGEVREAASAAAAVPAWGCVLRAAAAVFVALWAGLGTLEAKESEEARVRARVREYTDAATGVARREMIVGELDGTPDALVARLLRECLQAEARRAGALDLATRLRVPGVFSAARRHADGDGEAQVLALALAAPDPEAAAWFAERWTSAPPDSERFRRLVEALDRGGASVAAVGALAPSLRDPERADPTGRALAGQMALDDPSPAALAASWDAAWERFRFEAREFERDGADLLGARGWSMRGARRVGRNVRLAAGSVADLPSLPLSVQSGAGRVRLRVAVPRADAAFVSLSAEGGAQDLRLRCDGSVWFLVEGGARAGRRVEAPARPGEWSEVEYRIADPRLRDRPGVRDVRVLVDGREMRPSGGFWRISSPPDALAVGAAVGDEPTLLGGVTWRRAP